MNPTNSLRTFAGAVAIGTGGASGIGRALGEALTRRGALVVLADLQVELAQEVAARIRWASDRRAAGCHRLRGDQPVGPGHVPQSGTSFAG